MANLWQSGTDTGADKIVAALQKMGEMGLQQQQINAERDKLNFLKQQAPEDMALKNKELDVNMIEAKARYANAYNEQGLFSPEEKSMIAGGINPSTYTPLSKEERQQNRGIAIEAEKGKNKKEALKAKNYFDTKLQENKYHSMGELKRAELGAKLAVEYTSPEQASVGAVAADELFVPTEKLTRPFENLVSYKGRLFGSTNVSSTDLVGAIGSKEMQTLDDRIGMTPFDYYQGLGKRLENIDSGKITDEEIAKKGFKNKEEYKKKLIDNAINLFPATRKTFNK